MTNAAPPVVSIKTIAEAAHRAAAPYFMPDGSIRDVPLTQPYRTTYYGIGLCVAGSAVLMAGLHDHVIEPGSLITMSPTVIKQWKARTDDYDATSIFFQADFVLNTPAEQSLLDSFAPPGYPDSYVLNLSEAAFQSVQQQLTTLRYVLSEAVPGTYRDERVRHLIWALVYQVAELHQGDQRAEFGARKVFIANEFRRFVSQYATRHHSVGYYADLLFVTPKHLTETIKEATGRTAGAWIDEALTLEARVLLANPNLTVAQIADQLSFPDQSTFGKFFKKHVGQSPGTYRKGVLV